MICKVTIWQKSLLGRKSLASSESRAAAEEGRRDGGKGADVSRLRAGYFTEIYRPVVNGVVTAIEGLAGGLRARGHEVVCYTPSLPGYEESTDDVVRIPSLPIPARAPYRLTLPVLGRDRVESVVKGLDIIHVHSPFVTGWMGIRYARRYEIPIVFTYHTHLEAYAHYSPFDENASRFAASQLTRTFANSVDAVTVPTSAMHDHLRAIGVETRIEIIPSGIDVDAFARGVRDDGLRAQFGARDDRTRVLLTVSRLATEKNVDVLLDAFAQTRDPDLRLVVAGDGPLREALQARARELGVGSRVSFLGVIAREQLPALYASADAFVFASTSETQGLVLAEALAAGLPPVVADCASNRDVIGSSGTFVPPEPGAFASAMRGVRPALDDQRPGFQRQAQGFSLDAQVEAVLGLYRELSTAPAYHSA